MLSVLCVGVLPAATVPAAHAQPSGVPVGFVPSSTSWTGPQRGWVLGVTPCPAGRCPVLVRTWDGGMSWWPASAPDVWLPADNKRVRVHFADGSNGLVTDGTRLYATRTGGLVWRRVDLPSAGSSGIGVLASNDRSLFAIVASESGTRLYSSPLWSTRWRPVPGVELPDRGGGDIVAHGDSAYVALNAVHRSHGYWTSTGGQGWRPAKPPCAVDADPDLGLVPEQIVYALCSHNPGMGYMFKDLMKSVPAAPFTFVSRAPDAGITNGFAAASPSTMAITATGGGTALLHRGIDGGTSWHTPLVLGGAPMHDLQFTGGGHGVLVWGGPLWGDGRVYLTRDAGATWTVVGFGSG